MALFFFLALGVSFRGLGLVVGTHFVRFCLSFWVGGLGFGFGGWLAFCMVFIAVWVWDWSLVKIQVSSRFGRFCIVL